jgi:hypothetical protein
MKFDNSITLGNVLTAVSMLSAGAAAYANMNERISKVEQSQINSREMDQRHDVEIRDIKGDIKSVLVDIKADIKELRLDLKTRTR